MKNLDRISMLPENITESILARLPIQDVVRTSILSRNWRYNWTTLPDLVFQDSTFYTNPGLNGKEDEVKLVKVIYRILCQHKGPIRKFSLSVTTMMRSYPDIDRWISSFLSKNGIRELILEFLDENRYKIHSSLFSCLNLRELRLRGCIIPSLPPTFNGFDHLSCIRLRSVSVNNEGLDNLIAKCPKLDSLFLIDMDGLSTLKIDYAPKLENVFVFGRPINICLKNTPSLLNLGIGFSQYLPAAMIDNVGNEISISLINNLNCLSNLKGFIAGAYFLKVPSPL
ncbi:hypothetical protein REPUB_Repub01dG0035500 [Reevesia pubescens]